MISPYIWKFFPIIWDVGKLSNKESLDLERDKKIHFYEVDFFLVII